MQRLDLTGDRTRRRVGRMAALLGGLVVLGLPGSPAQADYFASRDFDFGNTGVADTNETATAVGPDVVQSFDGALYTSGVDVRGGQSFGLVAGFNAFGDDPAPLDGPLGEAVLELPGTQNPPVLLAGSRKFVLHDTGQVGVVRLRQYNGGSLVQDTPITVGGDAVPVPISLDYGYESDTSGLGVAAVVRTTRADGASRWTALQLLPDSDGDAMIPDFGYGTDGVLQGPWVSGGAQVLSATTDFGGGLMLTGRGAFTGADANPDALHVLKLTNRGVPDAGFGTNGIATVKVDANTATPPIPGSPDTARALTLGALGRITVVGSASSAPAGSSFVTRLNGNGTLDGTFGSDGVTRVPELTEAEGVALDGSGFTQVVGHYAVTQVALGAIDPDGTLVEDGVTQPDLGCDGGTRAILVTTGSTPPAVRLNALCGGASTLAITGLIDQAALQSVESFASTNEVPISPKTVELADVTRPNDPTEGDNAEEAGATLAAAPLRGSPLRGSPLRGSPLRGSPLRGSPLRGSPLRGSPLRGSPLTAVPLRGSPLRGSGFGWTQVLAGTPLANRPLQTVTLGDVLDLDPPVDVALGDIDLIRSPLRSVPLAALLLLGRPLSALPAPPPNGWCAALANAPETARCGGSGGVSTASQLLDVALLGADLTGALRNPIPLTAGVIGSGELRAPIADVPLDAVDFAATGLADYPTSGVADLTECGASCPATLAELQADDPDAFDDTASLGDLLGELRADGRVVTLQELLPGIVPADELPSADGVSALLARAPVSTDGGLSITLAADVYCDGPNTKLSFRFDVPGLRALPGSARLSIGSDGDESYDLADPASDSDLTYTTLADGSPIGSICPDTEANPTYHMAVSVQVGAPSRVGVFRMGGTVSFEGRYGDQQEVTTRTDEPLTVVDNPDPGPVLASAATATPGELRAEYLPDSDDVDAFSFTAPAAGSVVTITLADPPVDADLYVQGPPASLPIPAGSTSPRRQAPLAVAPLPDMSADTGADDSSLPPNGATSTISAASLREMPLRGQGNRRGTASESVSFVVRDGEAGKTFLATVAGYNGASSSNPYGFQMTVTAPDAVPACIDRLAASTGATGAYPSPATLPSATQTLIVWNQQRTTALYGATTAGALLAKLQALAAAPGVVGQVIPVDGHPTLGAGVRAAYTAWDGAPCSEAAANGVVSAIDGVITSASSGLASLRNVVLVGADDLVPQARVPDLTGVANEREEADQLMAGANDTPVSRALRSGNVLSDDPYGDFDPQAWLDGTLSVPDVALGRLVETPADAIAQIDRFLASPTITPTSARVTGYDFLSDGSTAILASLGRALGGTAPNSSGLINETWTAADARTILGRSGAGYTAVNAHFDHYRALPAAAYGGTNPPTDLLTASQVTPAAGGLLFSIGCHAGLSAVDAYAAGAGVPAEQLADWAKRITRSGNSYVANTGFGYGDTTTIAYSERLMADFADNVALKTSTLGQSLMYAKQRYAAGLAVPGVYDAKALNEATFYGLPMLRVGATGAVGAPALPANSAPGGARASSPFSVTPALTSVTTPRGRQWTADGKPPIVAPFRPIQPKTDLDVTPADGLPVHGAILDGLTSSDVANVDPVYARPAIDSAAREPEISADDVVFPATLLRTDTFFNPAGRRELLSLAAGQFIGDSDPNFSAGVQRLFSTLSGRVFRSGSSDYDPPRIAGVSAVIAGGTATFVAQTPDADAEAGVVLYKDPTLAAWRTAALTRTAAGTFAASGPVAGGVAAVPAFVQLYDAAGNVGTSTAKGPGFVAETVPAPAEGDPAFVITPTPGANQTVNGPVRVRLDVPDGSPATFDVGVDGAKPTPYTGSFTISAVGTHTILALGPDGAAARAVVRIVPASTAPQVTVTSGANPAAFQQPGSLTAAITPAGATGTVTFREGTTVLGTATVSNGAASIPLFPLSVGTHQIVARYNGDSTHSAQSAATFTQVVTKATSAMTIYSSVNPTVFGQNVLIRANVRRTGLSTGIPGLGDVTFREGTTVIGTAKLDGAGSATITLNTLAVGNHTIRATYSGSSTTEASTSPQVMQVVKRAASTVTLTSSANPARRGAAGNITAALKRTAPSSGTIGAGSVTFTVNGTSYGAASISGTGTATLAISRLPVGTLTIRATYSGSATTEASTSAAFSQRINP